MKYLIFNNESQANLRSDKCFDDLINKDGTTSYCDVIKHTADDLWAVIIDNRTEYLFTPQELLDAVNLTYDWFPVIDDGSTVGYSRIKIKGTTVIKTGAGIIRKVIVGIAGSGGNKLILYANTINSGIIIQQLSTSIAGEYDLNVDFIIGLTVQNTIGTSADFTVYYE
jgi:hypothetical protein